MDEPNAESPFEAPPSTIAVLMLGPIGDALLTSPLLRRLRGEWPEAEITAIAGSKNREAVSLLPGVDRVHVIHGFPRAVLDVASIVRTKFDLYIDPKDHRSRTSRILADLVRYRTGVMAPCHLPTFRSGLISPPSDGPHFTDSTLSPLHALGIDPGAMREPRFSDARWYKSRRDVSEELVGVINVSAGLPDREWSLRSWGELVDSIARIPGVAWSVISSPERGSEIEAWAGEVGIGHHRTPKLGDAIDVIAEADLVVTPDTSIVHICSMVGTPTVALFAHRVKNMQRFAPLARLSRSVYPSTVDAGVNAIGIQQVADAVSEMIEKLRETNQKSDPREI